MVRWSNRHERKILEKDMTFHACTICFVQNNMKVLRSINSPSLHE